MDSSLIARLIAANAETVAACQLYHNRERYRPPLSSPEPDNNAPPSTCSRETTPSPHEAGGTAEGGCNQETDREDDPANNHELVLSFDQPPHGSKGFVFGADETCDVRLYDPTVATASHKALRRISRKHFAIHFDQAGRLRLMDFSTRGTIVSYDGQAQLEVRRDFSWILFSNVSRMTIEIPKTLIIFTIRLGDFETNPQAHMARVNLMSQGFSVPGTGLTMNLQHMQVQSHATTAKPSGSQTPEQQPIYIRYGRLGEGTFGVVYKVFDVSTGSSYAAKTVLPHVQTSVIRKEVEIMRSLAHDHVIEYFAVIETRDNGPAQQPCISLLMELAPYGNLSTQHRTRPLTLVDTIIVVRQCLQALCYLHSSGVCHRDIKPDNVLVVQRDPWRVKLGDFGLAKKVVDDSVFKTHVGSLLYCAPEIVTYQDSYSPLVDIWSVGVLTLEYVFGLPKLIGKSPLGWHAQFFAVLDKQEHDMATIIREDMLQIDPVARKSASICLSRLNDLPRYSADTDQRLQETLRPTEPAWSEGHGYPDQRRDSGSGSTIVQETVKRTAVRDQATTSRKRRRSSPGDASQTRIAATQEHLPTTTVEASATRSDNTSSSRDTSGTGSFGPLTYPESLDDILGLSGIAAIPELRDFDD